MGLAAGLLGLWAGLSAAAGHDWICLLEDLGRRISAATFRTSRLRKRRGSFSGVLVLSSSVLGGRREFFELNGIEEVAEESIGIRERDFGEDLQIGE